MYQIKTRKNKTNLFVRDCITKALFQLLKNNEFEDISVSDIIKRAGVSRMGFYRNFSSKENVVEEYILDIFVETVEDIKSKQGILNPGILFYEDPKNIEHVINSSDDKIKEKG